MGTVRYTTVGGEVLAEKRGGVRRQYVPDPLGSTVALLDDSQAITDTFAYWPYGEESKRTGTTPTPLRFVGTLGYYRDGTARTYVRARHLDTRAGRWMTEDPIGFEGGDWSLYQYASSNPNTEEDRTGLQVRPSPPVRPAPQVPKPGRPWLPRPKPVLPPLGGPSLLPGLGGGCLLLLLFPAPVGVGSGLPRPGKTPVGCTPCPYKPPRTDKVPPGRPHYMKRHGGCCYADHTHHFQSDQGPPPECKCSYRDVPEFETCSQPVVPGPCVR